MATGRKHLVNDWIADGAITRSRILARDVCPEGVDASRIRLRDGAVERLLDGEAHVVSVIQGRVRVAETYALGDGVHVYLPPGTASEVRADGDAEIIVVTAPANQARVDRVVLRDEMFLRACAADRPLRWILTPQYLSRRLFLHHDAVLASKSGRPMSWFRTTMFDTEGLPPNDDGESVFKMSYDHRTESNFCYDVNGEARVRFKLRPYDSDRWTEWTAIDSETMYHLDETDGSPRNRHEVFSRGHATLFCMFDPAPTGVERHSAGAYSSYGSLDAILGTPEHEAVLELHRHFDEMLDTLSLARATDGLEAHRGTALWSRYETGLESQRRHESAQLEELDRARRAVVDRWRS